MYLVVFRNRKRADMHAAAYSAAAQEMEALARVQPGFLSFKSFAAEDGEVVALSEWADEATAQAWGRVAAHREVQARGRSEWYAEYTMYGCNNPRLHRFIAKDGS
ncbi:antibiotic biosynthesis monooxygenase [Altererythrobacter lauratis]|uniref:Antibiotic biosynthesis monooxygenase family protein n=1 Tax=Alteraurantiacibacter lauratis TaxID=2054627 RepID=A0ABV7EIB1_9SPHN